ncbi:hypothetical protein [Kitasatospora sp. NPDC051914]|uniref:hypothetical protein n=1 Tax=Kitasatospora sp. NPDC051914 TaxID=3154945 RepID=UPI00341B0A3A
MAERLWALGQAGYWLVVATGVGAAAPAMDTTPAGALDQDDLVGPALVQLVGLLYSGLALLLAVMWLVAWTRLKSARSRGRLVWTTALLSSLVVFAMVPVLAVGPGWWWRLPLLAGVLAVPLLGMVKAGRDTGPGE